MTSNVDDWMREVEGQADAFTMGWHAGYDAGVAAAEKDMADAWMSEVHRIRALANPHDDWMARVRAAETYSRQLADRLWRNPDAWKSAAAYSLTEGARRAGITPMTADDLARAAGVTLPGQRRTA
jgi:hypothetical protein